MTEQGGGGERAGAGRGRRWGLAWGRLAAPADVRESGGLSVAFIILERGGRPPLRVDAPFFAPLPRAVSATLSDLRKGERVGVSGEWDAGPSLRPGQALLIRGDTVDSARLSMASAAGAFVAAGDDDARRRREAAFLEMWVARHRRIAKAELEMKAIFKADVAKGEGPGMAFSHAVREFSGHRPGLSPAIVGPAVRMLAADVGADLGDPQVMDALRRSPPGGVGKLAPHAAWPRGRPAQRRDAGLAA